MELLYLTYFAVVILIGLFCTIISNKLKLPKMLLLILSGILLGNISYNGRALISFPSEFIISIFILSLSIIVFDASSRFKLREFDNLSLSALKLTIIFIVICMVILSLGTSVLFGVPLILAVLFGALMAGTDPGVALSLVKRPANKVIKLLEIESILNTPLIVLIPFLIIDLIKNTEYSLTLDILVQQIKPFALQIIIGIGTGLLVGLVIFKTMRKYYSKTISPLSLIGTALLAYILAENLGGNGVLSVTTAGLFFGSVYIKKKEALQEFSGLFSTFLEILVLIIIGLLIKIPFRDIHYILMSGALYLVYLIIRYAAVYLTFFKSDYTSREMMFMTLNTPKGIAVAVVAVILFTYTLAGTANYIEGIKTIVNLTLTFLLYSIIVSTVTLKFSKYFLRTELIKEEK